MRRKRQFYFAYGSNMSPARLRARLPSALDHAPARLDGHELAFHKCGADGSGKCDIPERERSTVFGLVYKITSDDFEVLDRIEGVGVGYEREMVDIHLGGERLAAHTYRATLIDPKLRPFSWYRQHVIAGALAAGLSESYLSQIRAVKAIRDPDLQREQRELAIYQGVSAPAAFKGAEGMSA